MERTIELLNENGNVRASVRNALTAQCAEKVTVALLDADVDVVATERGTSAILLGQDQEGTNIYYEISGVITQKDPSEKPKPRKGKAKTSETPAVPELF
jgi:hypothetical protein